MKLFVLLASMLMTDGATSTESESCGALPGRPQYAEDTVDSSQCVCGSIVGEKVKATLTGQMKLEAVCDLHTRPRVGGLEAVDLTSRSVNLDHVGVGEEWVYGLILLSGRQRLTGRLSYQPGPAGDLWFQVTGAPIAACNTMLSRELATLKLIVPEQGLASAYDVPESLRDAQCWNADAVIDVDSIWLLIGDTDEAGAYPSTHVSVSVTNFDTNCVPGEA